MTAYEKIAAEACQWCAKGWEIETSENGMRAHVTNAGSHISYRRYLACTAPTKDDVIEILAAENKRLREALEKAPHAPNCKYRPFETCIICGFGVTNHPKGKCLNAPENKWTPRSPVPCNCWKSALAGAAQETKE